MNRLFVIEHITDRRPIYLSQQFEEMMKIKLFREERNLVGPGFMRKTISITGPK